MTCAALAIASLSACASAPPVEVGAVASEPVSALGQDDYSATLDPAYVLRPSDVISITVFREPDSVSSGSRSVPMARLPCRWSVP